MDYILLLGAKSDIAKALARIYAEKGYSLYLAARESQELQDFANDIKIRNQRDVVCVDLDILDYASHQSFYDSLEIKPVGVISVVGYLGNQEKAQTDFEEAEKIINTNYTGIVSLLNVVSADFETNKKGFIVGISSVAGDRGRKSNYIYGSSKAAFTTYLSGLRNRLYTANVPVLNVKPGFVATKMTENLDLPKKLTAQPEEVARDIYKAQQKGKSVLYTKWFWKWIMLAIKNIPEFQFKKMSI